MSKYIISQAGKAGAEIEAATHETAYRAMCCWYDPDIPVIVTDTETGAAEAFTRILDATGNLQKIERATV